MNMMSANVNITSDEKVGADINNDEILPGYGVPQPSLATKDIVIIVFMFLLWAYSLLLTYKVTLFSRQFSSKSESNVISRLFMVKQMFYLFILY